MNFEKLQIVRDTIASNPEHFNMEDYLTLSKYITDEDYEIPETAGEYISTCSTVACIAGYTVAIFEPNHDIFCIAKTAGNILKISNQEADYIFMGHWSLNNLSGISVEETLWYLDGVLKTKDIQWNEKSGEYWPTNNEE